MGQCPIHYPFLSNAYETCVRPIIEYASTCWSPTSDKSNKMVEMVQHTAAKFVTNRYPKQGHYEDYSISDIIRELEWDTLEVRRNRGKLNMAYKILNGQVILPSDSLPKASTSRTTRLCNEVRVGSSNQLREPHSLVFSTIKHFSTRYLNYGTIQ